MSEKILPHDHGAAGERLSQQMPAAEQFRAAAELLKSLSDGSRLRIFWLLCHCEQCVTNIATLVDMTAPAVSHHLKTLRAQNLIQSRREGKEVYYKVADNKIAHWLHHVVGNMVEIGR